MVLRVVDVDRARDFYQRAGFHLDVDHDGGDFRVVQFTPPGSGCSISFGTGPLAEANPAKGLHLVVSDLAAARSFLSDRGVEVGEPYHFGPEGRSAGIDPHHVDYASYAEFSDPDGNSWVLQEVPSRAG